MALRNPPWRREEAILALDLFFRHHPSKISKNHPEVIALSQFLRRLAVARGLQISPTFRNPSGIHMKLCNLLPFDPAYQGKGLNPWTGLGKAIWDEFSEDRTRLTAEAEAIRDELNQLLAAQMAPPETAEPEEDEGHYPEGRLHYRQHRTYERNATLIQKKKAQALKEKGALRCEICGFDFSEQYGSLGQDFIECHHTIPVSEMAPGHETTLAELALVCSNCHRMLHRGTKTLAITALQAIIAARRANRAAASQQAPEDR